MQIIFSRIARQELDDAVRFYELEFVGLGKKLRVDLKEAVLRISEYPTEWPIEKGEI